MSESTMERGNTPDIESDSPLADKGREMLHEVVTNEPVPNEAVPRATYAELEQRNKYLEESLADIRAKHESLVAQLTEEVHRLNAELLNVRVQYRQRIEEFESAQLRIRNEFAKQAERQSKKLLVSFLEIVDDLERAIEAAERSQKDPMILNGIRIIWGNLLRILLDYDVRAMDVLGEKFDASLHEAVATAYVDVPERAGSIVEVVQTGYLIGNELLRPARVVVGKPVALE